MIARLLTLLLAASSAWPAQAQTSLLSTLYLPDQHQQQASSSSSSILKRDLSGRQAAHDNQAGPVATQHLNVCQVEDGESVAILEIEESRGSDVGQSTRPAELPISGSPDQIELRIESETHKYFTIRDKQLRLNRPLDRDATLSENSTPQIIRQPISSIYLQVSCTDKRSSPAGKKVIIPVLVKVLDLNDNAPKFSSATFTAQVDELTPVGSVILAGPQIVALDVDSANNGLVEYSLRAGNARSPVARAGPTSTTNKPPTRLVQRAEPTAWPKLSAESSSASKPTAELETSTTIAASSSNRPEQADSGRVGAAAYSEPTINLDSEPILNGPIEETDEEESDESFLASLNSTESEPEVEPPNRRRAKRQLSPARAELWTDLMSSAQAHLDEPDWAAQDDASLDYFSLELSPAGRWPLIKLKRPLDFERQRVHVFWLVATDGPTNSTSGRLSSSAKVVVRVLDGDDQGPAFVLDQQGCATHSVPVDGASASTQLPGSVGLGGATRAPGGGPPRNFKVIDQNFDFSDSPSVDLNPIQRDRRTTSSSSKQLAQADPADFSCLTGVNSVDGRAEYYASVMTGDSDYLLRIVPQAIRARDRDELNAPIRYTFVNSTPANFSQYFQMNPLDATIKQVAPIERALTGQQFRTFVQAQEQTANKLSSFASLTIVVVASDRSPPVIVPNSYSGYVEENSPIGTRVLSSPTSSNGSSRLYIGVFDGDRVSRSLHEFETTTDAFKVDKEGYVIVNRWPLDRDGPKGQPVFQFQVTARELGLPTSPTGSLLSLSSPISINVTLLDLNDNPPSISNASLLPIQMAASSRASARTSLTQIKIHDLDLAENSRGRFSIRHVSNGGRTRFEIDPDTGQLEALGRFQAGEQFSLTLQVDDELGRTSQGILELQVLPGPNTNAPQFLLPAEQQQAAESSSSSSFADAKQTGYSAEVSEAAAPHSSVIQVRASDPENEPVTYAIVDGNKNNDFYINSKTGMIHVANKLDREALRTYNLLVEARDSGGLATSRPVAITILDSNDQNPVFSKQRYQFSVLEGPGQLSQVVGRVQAHDADVAENGRVSYKLEWAPEPASSGLEQQARMPFELDEQSGDLRLVEPLDYERASSYSLVVSARDHGEHPRSAMASVYVQVIDVQDEDPYFEAYHLEVRLAENQGNTRVAQVRAHDPDVEPDIRYVLRRGDTSLFEVDANSGVVRTKAAGLDYEQAREYVLLVGTEGRASGELDERQLARWANLLVQHNGSAPAPIRSPLCRIDVQVQDVNDYAPEFLISQPLPVRIQDTAPLGTTVGRLQAEDRDGTEQNNQVRYELVLANSPVKTNERCANAFMVDPTNGAILVRSDLRQDSQSECQLVIRAYDLPAASGRQLSNAASMTVYIDHMAELSSTSMIGFADSSFTVELGENSPPNTLVKVLPILNKPKTVFPLACELIGGNEQAHFYVTENDQRDCELRTRDSGLDYEQRQRYTLILRINTLGTGSQTGSQHPQQARALAQVQVNVLDRNDNRPLFNLPSRYGHLTQGRLLAAVPADSPAETTVIQLRATDLDRTASSNGLVSYELLNELELDARLKVEPATGLVKTIRPVEDLPATRLPLRLRLLARDNPDLASETLESRVELIVNLIDDRHRLVLALKDSPSSRVLDVKEELLGVLQERTGLISSLEKIESLKVQRATNTSSSASSSSGVEADVCGTDLWFYLIEPGTLRIVASDDARIRSSLLESRAQSSLSDILDQTLGLRSGRVRLPYSVAQQASSPTSTLGSRVSSTRVSNLASSLIVIALSIAILSAIIVIYQCGSRSSYTSSSSSDKLAIAAAAAGLSTFGQPVVGGQFASNLHLVPSSFSCPKGGATSLGAGSMISSLLPEQSNRAVSKRLDVHPLGQQERECLDKEYETQMLKMSVLFDDSHSMDGQQLHQNHVNLASLA